jgi:cell division septation protein DedD
MNKVKIDLYISDLLYQYDCVIVPEFGGFVANYAPARIQPIQHKFYPPSKKVSFNKNLKNNDGLLANHIADRRSISYEEANGLIRTFVQQGNKELKAGDKLVIDKVGTLYLDPEGNIQFIATEHNDFLRSSFGLQEFRAMPIVRESREEEIEARIKARMPLLKAEEKKKRKYYWPAAAVLFFVVALALFFNQTYDWVDTGRLQYAVFNPTATEKPLYEVKLLKTPLPEGEEKISLSAWTEATLAPYTLDEKTTGLYVDDRREELKVAEVDNTEVVTENTEINQLQYHVMAGCFSNYENAVKLQGRLRKQGFEAQLLGTYKNLHAVSFASFADRERALGMLQRVKAEQNQAAWLLSYQF